MKTFPAVLRSTLLVTSIAVLVGIAGAQACGCSGSQGGAGSGAGFGQFVANAEACAKAEAQAIASGASVLDVANAVASVFAFASSPDLGTAETVIASLITKYGEPIVACAVVKGEAPPAAAGFGSGSDALRGVSLSTTLRRELAQKHGWQPQP